MPPLKLIRAALAVALARSAASQSLVAASAQVFITRKDLAKKECDKKAGKFAAESSGDYSCADAKERKILKCDAKDKCSSTDMPAPKSTSIPPAKSLAGTGSRSKADLKKICAQNKEWLFAEETSGAYSCLDSAAGIAMNCTAKGDCTEAHTPVHPR